VWSWSQPHKCFIHRTKSSTRNVCMQVFLNPPPVHYLHYLLHIRHKLSQILWIWIFKDKLQCPPTSWPTGWRKEWCSISVHKGWLTHQTDLTLICIDLTNQSESCHVALLMKPNCACLTPISALSQKRKEKWANLHNTHTHTHTIQHSTSSSPSPISPFCFWRVTWWGLSTTMLLTTAHL